MIYFTSDFHFCHQKEDCFARRGFLSADDMNEAIIETYNSIITDNDIVYILGDCIMNDKEKGIEYLKRLKGKKYLAIGNHDTDSKIELYKANDIFADIQMGYRFKYRHKRFLATHYPTITGNFEKAKPVYNLCGHSHSSDPFVDFDKRPIYHVEVDAHNLAPVSFDTICDEIIERRSII